MVITRTSTIVSADNDRTELEIFFHKGSKVKCGTPLLLIKGLTFTVLGIIFSIWTPFKLIMDERLRMHKGLPPFDLWAQLPDQIVMGAYVFNYTNAKEFLTGKEDVLKVQQVGPILYRERMTHNNITRNDNDTITYVAKHSAIYWDKANTINLNDTIIVPNYAALSMATFLHEAPFFVKFGFNLLMRQQRTELFKTITIQNFLWNYTDPILSTAHNLIPHLAPINNIGMLQRIYEDFQDQVTMYIGTEHGPERFSLIEKVGGSDHLPYYKNCQDKVTNATEGATYGQFLTRQTRLRYWRKTVCKVVDLVYEKDIVFEGLETYKYGVPSHSYNRTSPPEDDCYKGYPSLPNGLTDVSNCMYNVPIVASFPHFLNADPSILKRLEGLKPNVSEHESFIYAEPVTGIPLKSIARSQSNLVVRKLGGFSDEVLRFSDRVLPMFWLEYNQTGVPWDIYLLVYGAAVCLKPGQIMFIVSMFVVGFWYTVRFGRTFTNSEDYQRLLKNYRSSKKSTTYNNRRLSQNSSIRAYNEKNFNVNKQLRDDGKETTSDYAEDYKERDSFLSTSNKNQPVVC